METRDAIIGRRSVREYESKQVPKDVINQILKAGAMAPSAMDAKPCRFIVIANQEKIKELSSKVKDKLGVIGLGLKMSEVMKSNKDTIFYGAPLLILIVAEKTAWSSTDCALAAQNMMVQAYDLGLGSCFIGFATFLKDDLATLKSLGVKDSQELYCPLIFGYPKKWPKPKDRDAVVQSGI